VIVLDLIRGALRPLNVFTGNTTLTDDEAQDALQSLNWMLESWSNNGLSLFRVVRESFPLTSGLNPHTWGAGGNFNSPRPTRVVAASINVNTIDYPLPLIGFDDWDSIRKKNLQTAWPSFCYIEPGYPLSSVYLWPVPSGNAVNFTSEKPIGGFTGLYEDVQLPPGYADAIRYNLAVRLAPEYQVAVGDDVARLATTALKALQRTNSRVPTMSLDSSFGAGRGGYIIYTDGYR
jgi:hypothetical protein